MTTEIVNSPRSRNRAKAPAVGSHLALLNDMMAARIDSQTNARAMMNHTGVDTFAPWLKNTWTAAMQLMVSEPPIHTGLVIQYRKLFTAPARCPKASLVQ